LIKGIFRTMKMYTKYKNSTANHRSKRNKLVYADSSFQKIIE
jgi:hypothetical protein